ncbi:MAG: Peptidyl-tRNA hydrolase [Methanosaeta sp. PtaB.Bin039]|nr:MAG: Peptidyl-tRNA hydrolase [Methanosaeta sp. PtaB.Bin039]OPY44673.1 MAG: Peptidyl-tRNA hydrolase [Methanosaeta sp. PtaU1.Bin028]HOT06745.1 peptidyl-tRNA hydrolase Pth2 [Methanotrichaceae archaeon]HQF15942.1 peptidyl-tRNA hydrolase Pth2 [Methanotrichaceae archaeon]HQI90710.1 peptidyl-tRNA hydrolase Pth2 [Methanotrichaceae archaeon]
MEYKQCIVVREDLKLSAGKLAVQVAHAAIMSLERTDRDMAERWKREGQKKVVLRVKDAEALHRLKYEADRLAIPAAIVVDAGLTEIPPGTVTCLGLGPASQSDLDRVTGRLSLY